MTLITSMFGWAGDFFFGFFFRLASLLSSLELCTLPSYDDIGPDMKLDRDTLLESAMSTYLADLRSNFAR